MANESETIKKKKKKGKGWQTADISCYALPTDNALPISINTSKLDPLILATTLIKF